MDPAPRCAGQHLGAGRRFFPSGRRPDTGLSAVAPARDPGTPAHFLPSVSSEPPLPAADVLALLLSDARRNRDVELQRLQNPNQAQTDILTARATQALTGSLSSEVGRVVEQTFGVDTFQLT